MSVLPLASLMALLSCVKVEDTYVEALEISPGSNQETGTTTGTNNTGTTTTTTSNSVADNTQFISTEALNKLTAKVKIDLNASTYAKLKTTLGAYYVLNNAYVVALSKTGKYIAATVTCSHEPKKRIVFSNQEWYCTDHGARFSLAGSGLNSKGSKGLTIYNTATDGNTLIIY